MKVTVTVDLERGQVTMLAVGVRYQSPQDLAGALHRALTNGELSAREPADVAEVGVFHVGDPDPAVEALREELQAAAEQLNGPVNRDLAEVGERVVAFLGTPPAVDETAPAPSEPKPSKKAQRVRALGMLNAGYTVAEAAKALGVSVRQVERFDNECVGFGTGDVSAARGTR